MKKLWICTVSAALAFASVSTNAALQRQTPQPDGEQLIFSVPEGFVQGFDDGNGLTEYVPKGETVHNWTQMVTRQIYQGSIHQAGLQAFYRNFSKMWVAACPQHGGVDPILEGIDNGYPAQLFTGYCALNPRSGKPEYALIKTVHGDKSLYIVQFAFRSRPNRSQIGSVFDYLDNTQVCNSADSSHPCPKAE